MQFGMYDAFIDNGLETYVLNFGKNSFSKREYVDGYIEQAGEIFIETCEIYKPDWVHMPLEKSGFLTLDAIKIAKKKLPNAIFTNWAGDIRSEPIQFFLEMAKIVDVPLICSKGQLDPYKSAGCKNVQYWQAGIDHRRFYRFDHKKRVELYNKFEHDVVFCANNSPRFPGSSIRKEVVVKLNKKIGKKFVVYGTGWKKIIPDSSRDRSQYFEQGNIYNGSKIVISINNFNDVEMYFSARQLIAMASGTLTVSHYIPGLEEYFTNGKDLVWFENADECVDLVEYYLEHEEEAEKIAINGSAKVLSEHSWTERVKELGTRIGIL